MKEGKVWGQTEEVLREPTCSVHYLEIEAGGFCSEHRHLHKSNLFHVLEGELEVLIFREGRAPADITLLKAGEQTTVAPGIWHYFHAVQRSKVLEIYQAGLEWPDIDRRTKGGRA